MYLQIMLKGLYLKKYSRKDGNGFYHWTSDRNQASYYFLTDLVAISGVFPELTIIRYCKDGTIDKLPATHLLRLCLEPTKANFITAFV
jgi:hypothetical protein